MGGTHVSGSKKVGPSVIIEANIPQPAPRWALLERQLLDAQSRAIEEFFARYFDERGTQSR